MKKSLKAGLVKSALMVIILGACSQGGQSPRYATGAETEKRNQVELVRMPYLLLAESGGEASISEGSMKGLDRFFAEVDIRYGDILLIDRGEDVSEERVEAVTSKFRQFGLGIGETDGVFGPAPASGNMMLYVERYVVELPDCPDFSRPSTPDYQNAGMANMGCSNVTALGLMIANPRDLVDGQSDRATNAEPATRAVRQVRTTAGSGDN